MVTLALSGLSGLLIAWQNAFCETVVLASAVCVYCSTVAKGVHYAVSHLTRRRGVGIVDRARKWANMGRMDASIACGFGRIAPLDSEPVMAASAHSPSDGAFNLAARLRNVPRIDIFRMISRCDVDLVPSSGIPPTASRNVFLRDSRRSSAFRKPGLVPFAKFSTSMLLGHQNQSRTRFSLPPP